MIRIIKESDLPMLKSMCGSDLFISRIVSAYHAYGNTNIADFWVQTDDGLLNTVISKIDGVLTLSHVSRGNMDELAGFLYAIDGHTMLCDADFPEKINMAADRTGPILCFDNQNQQECDFEFVLNPPLKEVYTVMQKCKSPSFQPPAWEPFYLDMSHRTRHNLAISAGIRDEQGKLIGCGFTVSQTEQNAVLGGICVLPSMQNKGFGQKIVKALLSQLQQDYIYVFRVQGEHETFYRRLGFTECGSWAELDIRRYRLL